MTFWNNPEFIRHVRSNLRPVRVVATIGTAMAVAALVALAVWTTEEDQRAAHLFFVWMTGLQFTVVALGCAFCCAQTIAQEHLLKTFDFLRTTRLSAAELAVGTVAGAPCQVYLFAGCFAICGIPAGLSAGIDVGVLLGVYIALVSTALLTGAIGLFVSLTADRSAGAASILLVCVTCGLPAMFAAQGSVFPGFAGLSPIPVLIELLSAPHNVIIEAASIFGVHVPFLLMTILLHALFGSWMMLIVLRNLKKDPSETRYLTPGEALGFAAFLNLLFYALLSRNSGIRSSEDIITTAMGLNAFILFAVGLATANPREKLKRWWRDMQGGKASYFSESGFSWPWIVSAAGIAFAFLFMASSFLLGNLGGDGLLDIRQGAMQLGVFLVFIVRDVSFLQLCALTKMKRPIATGLVYLTLYYVAAVVVALSFWDGGSFVISALTPYAAFTSDWNRSTIPSADGFSFSGTLTGALIQTGVVVFLLARLHARMERVAGLPALEAQPAAAAQS